MMINNKLNKLKIGIRRKVALIICLAGGILIAVGVTYGYYMGKNLLRNIVINEHSEIANRISSALSMQIVEKSLELISLRHLWTEAAKEKNLKYKDMDSRATREYFLDMDMKWNNAGKDSLLADECSKSISGKMAVEIVKENKDIIELFITDKFGGLIAASGETSGFYQADKQWWQRAYNNGKGAVYVGAIEFNKLNNKWGIPMAIPLKDADGAVIGVVKSIIDAKSFFLSLNRIKIGETGYAFLVDGNGRIIFHENAVSENERFCPEDEFKELIKNKKDWVVTNVFHGYKYSALICFAEVENDSLVKNNIIWWVGIAQDTKEVFAPLDKLIKQGVLFTVLLLILMIILGLVLSTRFVRPIKKLYEAAEKIGQGDLDYKIDVKTGDEIEQLAGSFSNMVLNIKEKQKEILSEKAYADGIIASMIDTLIVVNPDATIRSVNKATCDLLKYSEDELIGKDVSLIFTEKGGKEKDGEEKREEEEILFKGKKLSDFIKEGSVRDFEMIYKTKFGEKIPVSFSGSVMYESSLVIQRMPDIEKDEAQSTNDERRIIGVVGVARDMRHIKALMTDLEDTKAKVENYAHYMEEKVLERTKDLEESRKAAINIMEDIRESKYELEKKTIELQKAKDEIESFSKGLEEKVKERTTELSILYEVSNAISYTMDYQALLKLIMESLLKIVDYDICASLLFDADTSYIILKPAYPASSGFADEVKNNLINSVVMDTGENISKKRMSVFLIGASPDVSLREERKFDKLRSSLNAPFVVNGKTVGMINVSSCRDSAFNENDIKIIYTIANQASGAIARLQVFLSAEKTKMESMVESMSEGVIMVDERGEVVVLNPQAKWMLGFGADEKVTSNSLNEKMKAAALDKVFQECRDKKSLVVKEILIPRGEKNAVLRCNMSPVKDERAYVIGIVIIIRDVTLEKEADKMKTDFVAIVSHELRTPLTTMKEFASIISDEIPGRLNSEQKEYLGIIMGNINRLARLINNLLDISKIESGKAELKKALVDIINLVKTVISALKPEADIKHIKFKISFPADVVNIYADPDKIIQIFTNLISNAVKFTKEFGQVTIEIKNMDKEIECSVSDTGVGIAAENIGKLFTKFQQFDRVDGAGAKGTGLGLAITKELVDAHNGRIYAESKFSKGSRFIFTLPKYSPEEIFKEYIINGFERAKTTNSALSVLVMHVNNLVELKEKYGEASVRVILRDLENIVKNNVRNDFVFVHKEDSVVIILENTNKKGTLVVQKRITDVVGKYEFKPAAGQPVRINIAFGMAVYPQEAVTEEEMVSAAEEKTIEAKMHGKTILIVDDEEGSIEVTGERLKANGYNILKAYNGEQALKIMETELPDLVISDFNMPVLDGKGLLRKMKQDKRLSGIPFIFLSGTKKEFEDRVDGITNGAIRYFLKPYNTEDFLRAIKIIFTKE